MFGPRGRVQLCALDSRRLLCLNPEQVFDGRHAMARGGFSRRRNPTPFRLYAILGGIGLAVILAVMFWFSGQAESRRPVQQEIRVPAQNVGVQPETAGGGDAPSQ